MEYVDGKIVGLMSGRQVHRLLPVADLWAAYRQSMDVRRPGSALGHNSFGWYTRRGYGFVYGESAVFGQIDQDGRFCVSHFCPASKRQGRDLLIALRQCGHDVGLAVTRDMAGMLAKLGYQEVGTTMLPFRGEMVEKVVFFP